MFKNGGIVTVKIAIFFSIVFFFPTSKLQLTDASMLKLHLKCRHALKTYNGKCEVSGKIAQHFFSRSVFPKTQTGLLSVNDELRRSEKVVNLVSDQTLTSILSIL